MMDDRNNPYALMLGGLFEGHLPDDLGAILEFLRPHGNILYIFMRNINKLESKALRRGDIRLGILHDDGALLVVVEFVFKGKSVMSFDCTFDARLVQDIELPNKINPKERLMFQVVAVEANTCVIKALRNLTMSPQTTTLFLSAVHNQLSTQDNGVEKLKEWLDFTGPELIKKATMRETGTTEDLIPLDIDKPEDNLN